MPRLLKDLRVSEVSLVTRGAGEGCNVVISKSLDRESRSNRLRKTFTNALRKARSEYDEEMSSPGFSRDPARTDTAESNEDAGAGERRNEDRFEDREHRDQVEGDVIATSVMPPRLQQ